jgi:hypothetical protein
MTELDKEVDAMAEKILAAAPAAAPAPAAQASPLQWPAFTCVSCGDVYPATSFKIVDKRPIPQLRGHFVLAPPRENQCVCQTCIRAHYEMLKNGALS